MKYFVKTDGGFVVSFGTSDRQIEIEISKETYEAISSEVANKPTAPNGYQYMLRAVDLQWELVELPPMPEPELTDEEALEILLGGAT